MAAGGVNTEMFWLCPQRLVCGNGILCANAEQGSCDLGQEAMRAALTCVAMEIPESAYTPPPQGTVPPEGGRQCPLVQKWWCDISIWFFGIKLGIIIQHCLVVIVSFKVSWDTQIQETPGGPELHHFIRPVRQSTSSLFLPLIWFRWEPAVQVLNQFGLEPGPGSSSCVDVCRRDVRSQINADLSPAVYTGSRTSAGASFHLIVQLFFRLPLSRQLSTWILLSSLPTQQLCSNLALVWAVFLPFISNLEIK